MGGTLVAEHLPPPPQVTCVEVVEAYIERIREVNPLINAVVKDR